MPAAESGGAEPDDAALKNAAARDFNAAAALQNSGFYARAVEKWDAFIQKYPKDERLDRVYYYQGVCQLHTKKHQDAVKTFETVLAKYPKFPDADGAQYNLGMAHYQIALESSKPDDYKLAAAAFATLASKYPESKYVPKALYFQGESLFAAGAKAESIVPYQKLIAEHAGSSLLPDACYALGTAQQELHHDADAAKTFEAFLANKALDRHELANEVRLRLGMALFNQKKYGEAEPHFAAVAKVADFPGADFALLRQGQCRLETGKVPEAANLFSEFLRKFPESEYKKGAQLAAGKCYYLSGKYDEARKMLEPLAPGAGDVPPEEAYWLARTMLKTGNPPEALAVLDRALAGSRDGEFTPYLELTRIDAIYDIPDRRKEAPAAYEAFVKRFPSHALTSQAIYMAALSALGAEDYAAARRHAGAFLENPFNSASELTAPVLYIAGEAHLLAAQAGQQGADVAKAEGFYRQLAEKYPNHAQSPRANLRIGWCLHQLKKYDDSVKYLREGIGKLRDPIHLAEAHLLIGRDLAALDQHREAVAAYEEALRVKPDWPRTDEVLLALAASLRATGDSAGAAERLKRLAKDYPNSAYRAQALYLLGEIAQEQKDYDEAIRCYSEVVEKHAENSLAPAATYGLAASCFAKKDDARALPAVEKLLAAGGEGELAARGRYLRGLIRQRKEEYEPAVSDFEAFLADGASAAEAPDARYALALCRVRLGKLDLARQAIAQLIQASPEYANIDRAYYELAHALRSGGQDKEAADTFRTLAEKHPKSTLSPESWFHVGHYHESLAEKADDEKAKTAEIAKAAEAFAAGLKDAQGAELREKLRYKLGDMQFRQEKFEDAAATLAAQVAEFPQGPLVGPGRYLAAESLYKLNKFAEALPLFARVADDKVEKYHAYSLYRAGDCAAKTNNWPESQRRYQDLIAQFPKFEQTSEARYGLAWAMQNQKNLDEASETYKKVTEETETETAAKARFMMGEIAFAQKKYEDAIEQYLMVTVGYPYAQWQALAQLETGRCFKELGQKDKAIAALEKMLEKFPDHPKAEDAKRLIEELRK
jgi:TolA-binding protein